MFDPQLEGTVHHGGEDVVAGQGVRKLGGTMVPLHSWSGSRER